MDADGVAVRPWCRTDTHRMPRDGSAVCDRLRQRCGISRQRGRGSCSAIDTEAGMRGVTVARSFVRDMAAYLDARGLASAAVVQEAGIDIDAEEGRITGAQMASFWSAALRATGDPDLGLHMAVASGTGALDIVCYVMLSSSTAADALRRGARLMRLLNDGVDLHLAAPAETTIITLVMVGDGTDPLWTHARQLRETIMAGLVHQLRLLTGHHLVPHAVRFPHSPPPHGTSVHEAVFGVRPAFSAPDCALELPSNALDTSLRSANAALLAAFTAHADAALVALDAQGPAARRVTAEILTRLKGEAPGISEVARSLAMSARSLQRALADEGTSYQEILDAVRRELAIRHLASGETVAKIAWLLGFSETSAFYRAQRRWESG